MHVHSFLLRCIHLQACLIWLNTRFVFCTVHFFTAGPLAPAKPFLLALAISGGKGSLVGRLFFGPAFDLSRVINIIFRAEEKGA